jgi:serine/threonine protein kinase
MEIPVDDVTNDQPTLRVLKAYYKINKVIGKGAFGIVYKAFELCSGRRVAVKQIKIDEQNKNLVLKEVEVLKKVEHPNIVQYFNFLKEDNYMFIIMEFLEGGTLKEYIKENQDNITEEI